MKILWLDLETTGLEPTQDVILEVACKVADFDKPFDAKPLYESVIFYNRNSLRMDHFVWEMHTKNKLLEAMADSLVTLNHAEDRKSVV